jgi:hypothetical protein
VLAFAKNRIVATLGVGLLLAGAAWWLVASDDVDAVNIEREASAPGAAGPARGQGGLPSAKAAGAKGAGVDMQEGKLDAARLFDLGFAGGLTIDRETRATLDALFMTMPPTPSAREIEELESALRNGLPKDDAEKAIKMFHGYRGYQAELRTELQQMGIPATAAQANAYFDRLAQLQRHHFDDATATALFGQENLNARLAMQAGLINQNSALSPNEKKEQLDLLRSQLPADQRDLIPDPTKVETDQQLPSGQPVQSAPQ